MHGEQLHNVELLFGQVHRLAVLVEAPGAVVDNKPLVELHLGLALAALLPAQVGGHPGAQLIQVEGLDNVIVAPGLKAQYLVRRFDPGGQKENGAGYVGPDSAADLQPVHIRHADIQQDQVGPAGEPLQGLPPAGSADHPIAGRFKILPHQRRDARLVIRQ